MFSCGVCDLLAEDLHLELQVDAERSRKSQEAAMRKLGGSEQREIRVALDPRATVRRMIESTNGFGDAIESWRSLAKEVVQEMKRVLQQNAADFAEGFMGIPLRQHHTSVWLAKQKICGAKCGAFMPRHRNFPQNACGWCQETMRDIAIIWSLQSKEGTAATKLKNMAYRVIDSVCERVHLRHSPTYANEIQTACNELLDDHGGAVVRKLTALSSTLSHAVTISGHGLPGPRDACEYWRYVKAITPEVCESLTEHCRAGEAKVDLIPEVIPRELRNQYEKQIKRQKAMADAETRLSEKKAKDKKAHSFQKAMAVPMRKRVPEKPVEAKKKPDTKAHKSTTSPNPPPPGPLGGDEVRRVGGTAVRARTKPASNPAAVRRAGGARLVHRAGPPAKPLERANQTGSKKKWRNVGGAALLRMAARKKQAATQQAPVASERPGEL